MTPQEAVDFLVRTGVNRNDRAELRRIFESVKATAEADETRRCASLARKVADFAESCDGHKVAEYFRNYANDILRTGGLKVEAH